MIEKMNVRLGGGLRSSLIYLLPLKLILIILISLLLEISQVEITLILVIHEWRLFGDIFIIITKLCVY